MKPIGSATAHPAANGPFAPPPRDGPSLRRRIITTLQAGLQRTGIAPWLARRRRPTGATVLMYHSVAKQADARWIDPRNHLPATTFEEHVAFLAAKRRVISLEKLREELNDGREPPTGTVAITFDDGYRDNLTVAATLLRKYDLPATLFLATGYITRRENQWVDQLYAMFATRTRHQLELPDHNRFDLRAPAALRYAYRAAALALLTATCDERATRFAQLRDALRPAAAPPPLTLGWDEVATLRVTHPGFTLGCHTRDHLDLTALEPAARAAELRAGARDLAEHAPDASRWFSCPYNRCDADVREAVAEAGFVAAFGREAAERVGCTTDRFTLPRVNAPASLALLEFVTSGMYPELSQQLFGRA